jgi:biopolymer transport protein ExbB
MTRSRLAGLVLAMTLSLALVPGGEAQQQPPQQQPQQPQRPPQPQVTFDRLAAVIRELRESEAALAQRREAEFRAELQRQQQLAREAQTRRDRAEARGSELDRQWQANDRRIAELSELLTQHQGNLGELFGVTRQVAGDAANTLSQSLLSAQYRTPEGTEERAVFLRRLAAARALPSIYELERLWYELLREMTDAAKVAQFEAEVLSTDLEAPAETRPVVRVGPFTAVSGGEYLGYLPSRQSVSRLDGRLPRAFRTVARELEEAPPGSGYVPAIVDMSRGALLGVYVQRPNWIERIERGEIVGYVIVAVGILGVVLALFQYVYLITTRFAVRAQLRSLDRPTKSNPLGRVLMAGKAADARGADMELAELRISEAILRETPKLERFQSFLRLAVAAGPLLGLIGTVVGMIITFKAIIASGTSDPRLMATGIGQAMIATVLGLGIAIPLLFINAGLTVLSRGITQVLDEQSQVMLASYAQSRKNGPA